MTAPPALASFDPVASGYRLTLRYEPSTDVEHRGTAILAPAFAEEMNRCRRMTSLAARRLAKVGWRVCIRDLHGCGDSSGDFADSTWHDWVEDLGRLVDEAPEDEPLWLWGVRAGALLLPSILQRRPNANVLLWQPAVSGRTVLGQFLRLKSVAAALSSRGEHSDVKSLRIALADGRPQEVAGYTISPALAAGLESAVLALPEGFSGRVAWLEVAASEPASLLPAGEGLRGEWTARGAAVDAFAVEGNQFWQTQETTECEALLAATERLMLGSSRRVVHPQRKPMSSRATDPHGPRSAPVPGSRQG